MNRVKFWLFFSIFTAFVIDSFLNQYALSENRDFPWMNQENTVAKRLTDHNYLIFRRWSYRKWFVLFNKFHFFRHKNSEHESEDEKVLSFNFTEKIRASFRPSNYRRTSLVFENETESDRVFLLRWSGSVNINPEGLFNLTKDIN